MIVKLKNPLSDIALLLIIKTSVTKQLLKMGNTHITTSQAYDLLTQQELRNEKREKKRKG